MGNQTISFDNDYRWFRHALGYGLVATVAITLSGTASFAQGNNAMILHEQDRHSRPPSSRNGSMNTACRTVTSPSLTTRLAAENE
jgi:hypothetical protein